MDNESKYKEILILAALLTKKGIPYEIESHMDGHHIGYPNLNPRQMRISVIEHFGSYGHEDDLLEIMQDKQIYPFLSAQQVLSRIEELEKQGRRQRKWKFKNKETC